MSTCSSSSSSTTTSTSYRSTRGAQHGLSFEDVVLGGLATDGGLYVPEVIPNLTKQEIERLRPLSFVDLAFEVVRRFVGPDQVPHDKLHDILTRSFASFRSEDVTPTVRAGDMLVLELFHGPTFAFKDVALQFLGNLFEFFLTRGKQQTRITILGATSGDTGSAAIHGLRGKRNVECFILFPRGRVTEIQQRQMTTIPDSNIHCISVEGTFDDAQAIVKKAFADTTFRDEVQLGAVNSINWARVLAQITYYFYSYLQVTKDDVSPARKISFAVPTGNFGDILAGYYAKRMGLPVDKLMVCTNDNDILHRFFETGTYSRQVCKQTLAPSMDISVSSNFERYLFYLAEENPETVRSWMTTFESTNSLTLTADIHLRAREDFVSYAATEAEIVEVMRETHSSTGYLACPHTATAVAGLKASTLSSTVVVLATAHPAKFADAVTRALHPSPIPSLPPDLAVLFQLPTRETQKPATLPAIQAFMRAKLSKRRSYASWTIPAAVVVVAVAIVWAIVSQKRR